MRFKNASLVDFKGIVHKNKNIRIATQRLIEYYRLDNGVSAKIKTPGIARLSGREIPVKRGPRGFWYQIGYGIIYNAN